MHKRIYKNQIDFVHTSSERGRVFKIIWSINICLFFAYMLFGYFIVSNIISRKKVLSQMEEIRTDISFLESRFFSEAPILDYSKLKEMGFSNNGNIIFIKTDREQISLRK